VTRHAQATCYASRSAGEEAIRFGTESAAAEYLAELTDIELHDPRNWEEGLASSIDRDSATGREIVRLFMIGDLLAAATLMNKQVRPWCKQVAEDAIAKEADIAAREWDGQ
jgi:hypothetical protein